MLDRIGSASLDFILPHSDFSVTLWLRGEKS
jgi:hypothetical protein